MASSCAGHSLLAVLLLSLFCEHVKTNNVSLFCQGTAGFAVLYLPCGDDVGIHLSYLGLMWVVY